MCKTVLSISGNVYKQQEIEIDTVLSEIESKYDFTFKEKQLTANQIHWPMFTNIS